MGITEHMVHPFINALGWTLLHSLWQILLIAVLWKLAMAITAKSTAALRYRLTLWTMLAIPASFVYTFTRQYTLYRQARQIVALEFETMEWMAAPGTQSFYLLDRAQPLSLQQFDAYTPYVFWVYITGLLIVSLLAIRDYTRVFRLKRSGLTALPGQWQQRISSLIETSKLSHKVKIWLSARVEVAMVVGFLKPVILLPLAMLSSMTTEQIESIILHELCHIRRKDHYVNALQTLLEIAFFYHPGIWLISRRVRQEREQCVDEWVIDITGNPVSYARALVSLEENRSPAAPQPALAATQSNTQLLIRIKHMMTMKTRKFHAGQKLAAMMAILAAFASVAWVSPARTIDLRQLATDYSPDFRESRPSFDLATMDKAEVAPDDPPAVNNPEMEKSELKSLRLLDGTTIQWQDISEQNRKELEKAIEEARITIEREVRERFQTEEFRREMQKANEAYQKVMQEVMGQFNNEEFQQEMNKLGEDFRKAMEQVEQEFNTEAFHQRMQELKDQVEQEFRIEEFHELRKEVSATYQKMAEDLRKQFQGEEFQTKMRSIGETHRQTMEGLKDLYNMDEFQQEMNKAMEELRKAMDALREIDWEERKRQEEDKRNK